MSGYIKLYRKFFRHDMWEEERVFSRAEAWIDLLSSAWFQEEPKTVLVKGTSVTVERGQILVSIRSLASRWRWSRSKVSLFLSFLEAENMVSHKKSQWTGVVTILNYSKFNPLKKNKRAIEKANKKRAIKRAIKRADKRAIDFPVVTGDTDDGSAIESANERAIKKTIYYKKEEEKEKIPKGITKEKESAGADLSAADASDAPILKNEDSMGKDDSSHRVPKDKFEPMIIEIYEYLNLKTGKRFRHESRNSKFLRSRLRDDGADVWICKEIIDMKCKEWIGDPKMEKFLRVETLFNATNFEKYLDEYENSTAGRSRKLSYGQIVDDVSMLDGLTDSDVFVGIYHPCEDRRQLGQEDSKCRVHVKDVKNSISRGFATYTFHEVI